MACSVLIPASVWKVVCALFFVRTHPYIWPQAYTLWVDERHSGKCRKPLTETETDGPALGNVGSLKKANYKIS